MRTMRQWLCLVKYRILSLLKYPADIVLGVLGTILWHMPNFVLITVIFQRTECIEFSKGYLVLLYGLSVFGDGVQHTFAEALWQFGNTHIKTAKYDEILTKPANSLMQVISSRFDIDGFGGIIWGTFCSFYGYAMLAPINMLGVIEILMAMICSSLVFLGINILTSATAFLLYDNFFVTHTIFELHKFSRFPKEMYPKVIGIILTFVIPVFGATYYPVNSVRNGIFTELLCCFFGCVLYIYICILIWNACARLYKSTGS